MMTEGEIDKLVESLDWKDNDQLYIMNSNLQNAFFILRQLNMELAHNRMYLKNIKLQVKQLKSKELLNNLKENKRPLAEILTEDFMLNSELYLQQVKLEQMNGFLNSAVSTVFNNIDLLKVSCTNLQSMNKRFK